MYVHVHVLYFRCIIHYVVQSIVHTLYIHNGECCSCLRTVAYVSWRFVIIKCMISDTHEHCTIIQHLHMYMYIDLCCACMYMYIHVIYMYNLDV